MRTERTVRVLSALFAAALLAGASAGCAGRQSAATSGREVAPSVQGAAPAGQPAADSITMGAQSAEGAPTNGAAKSAGSRASRPADRMVIRNANVRLEVPKVQDAVARLRALAKTHGGIVSDLQLTSDTDGGATPQPIDDPSSERILTSGLPFSARITVLVPVGRFDAFRSEAEKLGKLLSETSADDDVTQAHADLAARLANARSEEARLRTFFDKARSVGDMLSIERELARVRGEIESMDAQLKTMERQAAMATLTVELVEPQPIVRPSNGIDWGFADALTTGIQGMAGLLRAAIVTIVATSPLWIAALVLALVVGWRVRARKARREAGTDTAA